MVTHVCRLLGVCLLLQWWMWEVVVLLAGLLPDAEVAVAVTGLSTQIQTIPWIMCYSLGTATATRVSMSGTGLPLPACCCCCGLIGAHAAVVSYCWPTGAPAAAGGSGIGSWGRCQGCQAVQVGGGLYL